jgi:hypothetical protein
VTGPTGPTGPYDTVAALASNDANDGSTTTMRKITGLDTATGTGTFQFKYMIRYQTSATTTGIKFAVNHTGTVSAFLVNHHWAQSLSTAASALATQNITTGYGLYSIHASRAKNTTVGPSTAIDTANADMLWVAEGMFICSITGNLELYSGSEVAAVSTVMAGASLVLTKVAS